MPRTSSMFVTFVCPPEYFCARSGKDEGAPRHFSIFFLPIALELNALQRAGAFEARASNPISFLGRLQKDGDVRGSSPCSLSSRRIPNFVRSNQSRFFLASSGLRESVRLGLVRLGFFFSPSPSSPSSSLLASFSFSLVLWFFSSLL